MSNPRNVHFIGGFGMTDAETTFRILAPKPLS
jgi:hypothetical protein